MELSTKVLNKFIKFLLWAQWLSMTVEHVNTLIPLLGAKRADAAREVKRLVSHGQICTFTEKGFKSRPLIGPTVLPDLFVQDTGQIKPT